MSQLPYHRAGHTDEFLALCEKVGREPPEVFETPDGLRALIDREDISPSKNAPPAPRWHVSVSRQDRVPSWDEFVRTVHQLRPGVWFVCGIPPENYWMSVHPFVLHAWEMCDGELRGHWMRTAQLAGGKRDRQRQSW